MRAVSDPLARLLELGRDREAAELGAAGTTTTSGGSMQPLEQLDQLGPALATVVEGIGPDQLDEPTPCASFSVRDVLTHMIGGAGAFAAAFRGQPAPTASEPDDVLAAFGPALGDLVAAISAPGALDRTITAPFGEVPGETFARFVVLDGLVHGWDLATATGQLYDPPSSLVDDVTAFAHVALDPLRDGDTFAAATDAAPDASAIERLAAYTGRQTRRTT